MGKLKSLVVLAAAVSALVVVQAAIAQYPSPVGSVVGLIADTTPSVGDEVVLSGQALGPDGTALADVPVTFTVITDPGGPNGNVAVGSKVITKMTNAEGVASTILRTGSTPGTIVIGIESQGKQSTLIVEVGGTSQAPQAGSDAGPVSQITPPNTGDGGLK